MVSMSPLKLRAARRLAVAAVTVVVVVVVHAAPASAVDTGFSRARFSNPARIVNRLLPLIPGTQLVLEGTADIGNGLLPHRVVFVVTDVTKVVNGVRSLAVWDRDFNNGVHVENEVAFFAQDDAGNVWNLGEYPEEYEGGAFVGAPQTWLSGIQGAQAGIHMLANPTVGATYIQGYAPEIDFLAEAKVLRTGQQICGPARCYYGVVVIDEFSSLEPEGGHVLKYHAPGIGIVKVEPRGDPDAETLDLVQATRLDQTRMAQARNAVLNLDTRAYTFAADVWQNTPPARVTPDWANAR